MTREEALAVVVEAADRWAQEIAEYIEPAEPGPEYAWGERVTEINEAIAVLTPREGQA